MSEERRREAAERRAAMTAEELSAAIAGLEKANLRLSDAQGAHARAESDLRKIMGGEAA